MGVHPRASASRRPTPAPPACWCSSVGAHIGDLELRDELFDDFCLLPFHPSELEVRVRHLLWRTGADPLPDVVEYRELTLNVATYQAAIAGRPLDLTYMEYELLKFLSQNPGKVFTREVLLNRVWGYEYYGGARTVDVHVRRLRAKLGEEHAVADRDRALGRLPLRPSPLVHLTPETNRGPLLGVHGGSPVGRISGGSRGLPPWERFPQAKSSVYARFRVPESEMGAIADSGTRIRADLHENACGNPSGGHTGAAPAGSICIWGFTGASPWEVSISGGSRGLPPWEGSSSGAARCRHRRRRDRGPPR